MEASLFVNSLGFAAQLILPILLLTAAGGAAASIIGALTAVDDPSIAVLGRLAGACLGLYLLGGSLGPRLFEFAKGIWSNPGYF